MTQDTSRLSFSIGSTPAPPPPHDSTLLFLNELQRRRAPFTYVFLLANCAVFLLMQLSGGSMNEATLLAFGVKSNTAINQGEVWRFFTPIFIHIGLLHLLLNSYALWIIGEQVERIYGSARFATFYVLMGVSGVAGSYLFHPRALSAGASGAIFGLLGVLLVFGLRHAGTVPRYLGRAIWVGILPVIVINLIIGFVIPVIDNAAHIGGLLAGMALAAAFGPHRPGSRTPRVFQVGRVLTLTAVLAGFFQVGRYFDGPPLRLSNLAQSLNPFGGPPSATDEFVRAVNSTERSFALVRRATRNGEVLRRIDELAARLSNSIERVEDAPSLSAESDRLMDDVRVALERQHDLIEEIRQDGGIRVDHTRRLEESGAQLGSALDDLVAWVESNGARYGLRLRRPDA